MSYPEGEQRSTVASNRVDPAVRAHVRRMRDNASSRDEAIQRVLAVRDGDLAFVAPDHFSQAFPKPIVANFIDTEARSLARKIAPLPKPTASAGTMQTNVDKARGEKTNRIVDYYWRNSKLKVQMRNGADQYLSFGFLPFWVEANYGEQCPHIHVEDPNGAYYELDRNGDCRRYARIWRQDAAELAALYPEYEYVIMRRPDGGYHPEGVQIEVVRYVDDKVCLLYLPERQNAVIGSYSHGLDFCPVVVAVRPGVSRNPRGQFDDVLWVQIARNVMATLTLEAGQKSVQAPTTVPSDVTDIPTGPDAVIVTDHPEGVGRVQLQVPNAAFALTQTLQEEMARGAGIPDSRMGIAPAGGTTGRGVEALMGAYDDQIAEGQAVIGEALRISSEMCIRMEIKLWPKKAKTITGTLSGESYKLAYTPGKDLSEDTRVEVSYGFASGLSPNAAIVSMLQMRGDNLIGRDTVRRNLPYDIDVEQAQREIDVQQAEDAMMQGLAAGLTMVGQMIAQGRPDVALQFLQAGAQVVEGRSAGEPLQQLLVQAFAPPPAPPSAGPPPPGMPAGPGGPPAPGAPPGGGGDMGFGPGGLPDGTAPGQAEMGPGGRPSIMDLTAGFRGNGSASLNAGIRRRLPTG